MPDYEVLVLAGGLGMRLKPILDNIPKPMAPIAGKPFLEYVFKWVCLYNVSKIILCVGYRYGIIQDYFGLSYNNIKIGYSIEDTPLGTGGAIKKALAQCEGKYSVLLNGDTFFDVNINELCHFHKQTGADVSLALKHMENCSRYGSVSTNKNRVTAFNEKQYIKKGFINGGVYVLNNDLFAKYTMPDVFSFESDFLKEKINELTISAKVFDKNFIDIGIPSAYKQAQNKLPKWI